METATFQQPASLDPGLEPTSSYESYTCVNVLAPAFVEKSEVPRHDRWPYNPYDLNHWIMLQRYMVRTGCCEELNTESTDCGGVV